MDPNTSVASAFQSFQLGAGYPTEVATYTRSFPFPTRHTSHTLLNTGRKKVWREDGPTNGRCLWELHDVWRWSEKKQEAVVLREHYFDRHPSTGKKVLPDAFGRLNGTWLTEGSLRSIGTQIVTSPSSTPGLLESRPSRPLIR